MVEKSARRTRHAHSPAFKAQFVLAAVRDDKSMAELCTEFEVHACQILERKRQLLAGGTEVQCHPTVRDDGMACPEGLEPPTPSLEGWCSIQLSYGQSLAGCGF